MCVYVKASHAALSTSDILLQASDKLSSSVLSCQDDTLEWITQWDELHANLEPLSVVAHKL